MKAVKIIVIFFVIAAIIYGILHIHPDPDIDSGGNGTSGTLIKPPSHSQITAYITQQWENTEGWDESIFKSLCSYILNSKQGREGHIMQNRDSALNRVWNGAQHEWAKENCERKVIEYYVKAMQLIAETYKGGNYKVDSEQRYTDLRRIKAVYDKALEFANKDFKQKPTFNSKSHTWKPYDESKYRRERNEIQEDIDYKTYLSNITVIKNALDNTGKKIEAARMNFYKDLAEQIKEEYKGITDSLRTSEQNSALGNVIDKFEKEASNHNSLKELNNLKKAFENDVIENQKRAK